MPEAGGPQRILVDDDALLDLFDRLADGEDLRRSGFRWVLGLITIAYTYLGGMTAVLWTDLMQLSVYVGGSVVAGVVLIDFPRTGVKSIGLITSNMLDTDGEEVLSVYIPTTPIPSSGFLVIVPASDVTQTEMTVEDALRVVISGGIRLDNVFNQSGFQVPGRTRSNQ